MTRTAPLSHHGVPSVSLLVLRIMAEYDDLPGLALTEPQIRRIWTLDDAQCLGVLGALLDIGFLRKTHSGYFVRDR